MWKLITCACLILISTSECRRLHDYVSHFEELNYDRQALEATHGRAKRSTNSKRLHLEFQAFGKHFNLNLQPDTDVFSPNARLETDGHEEDLDTSHIYSGDVWGEHGSSAFGSVIDGRFTGKIHRPDSGSYWIEAAEKYVKNPHFHSVIYKEEDVETDKFQEDLRKRREASAGTGSCGNSDPAVRAWMASVQKSADPSLASSNANQVHDKEGFADKYREPKLERVERQATGQAPVVTKNTCGLFLQADPELWRYYNETVYGKKATSDQVKQAISDLFYTHVREINSIYTQTRFTDGTQSYGGYNFRVDRVLINTTAPCDNSNPADDNLYCNRAIDASNLLNLNSYRNHDDYCLAFIFTYRDFTGGTLGLAWVADPSPSKGGVCTKWAKYNDDTGGLFVAKSLNTGIVTFVNYGKAVLPKVSIITFSHEIGHSFGSPHDPQTDAHCAPLTAAQSQAGNFIMFASATSGDMTNNNKFSPCSTQKIGAVLTSVNNNLNGHLNCFMATGQAFCGNAIREGNETCDCGYKSDCAPGDVSCCRCCVSASESATNMCKLRPNMACDPSMGPCCQSSCSLYSAAAAVICKPATDCQEMTLCNGNTASCPTPVPKANLTTCNGNTQVCMNGECVGSICTKIDSQQPWYDCEAPLPADGNMNSLCYISCQQNTSGAQCWSSSRFSESGFPAKFKNLLLANSGGNPIPLAPGRACNSYQGYCDVFQKCRLVDADGPLARLKNLLFSPSTLAAIKSWIEVYWWAVALMALGLILLMAGFIKCCAVHTPSSNPKKAKHRRISETLTLRRRRAAAGAARDGSGDGRQQASTSAVPSGSSGAPPAYSDVPSTRAVVPGNKGKQKAKGERYEMH